MRTQVGAVLAAGVFGLSLLPAAAPASTEIIGSGFARECSVRALLGQEDSQTISICSLALEQETMSDSNYAKTLVNRGIVHMRRTEFKDAAHDFDQAEKISADVAEIFVNRGVVLMKQHQYAPAIVQMDKGISLGPQELEKAYFDRAIAKEAVGDVKGAYYDFAKASELAPNWAAPKTEMARFTIQRGGA